MMIELRTMGIVGDPFEAKCPKCGKTLASGKFTIMTLNFFILTTQPPIECCDEKVTTPLLFKDSPSAIAKIDEIATTDPELKQQGVVLMENLGLCYAS